MGTAQGTESSPVNQRLESHKATLIAALTVVGRRNDVVLHRNIGVMRGQLDGLMLKQDEGNKVPRRIFQLPSKLSDFFTGRDKELDLIEKILTEPNTTVQRRVVLWGYAGAGKTQTALSFALKHEKNTMWYFGSRQTVLRSCRGHSLVCRGISNFLKANPPT
jgi:hypothetical protein